MRGSAVAAFLALAAVAAGCGGAPEPIAQRDLDPLAYRPGDDGDLERRAAAGNSHTLYVKSPGGVAATARRVERFRGAIERAAAEGDVDADLLEAMVFLESAGRPDAVAGGDPVNAAGLTQIVAETGQSLLDMDIDVEASRRLTRRHALELRRGRPRAAARALAARRRVDERFVPDRALAGAVRYLEIARERFGRDDLAVASYHMGIGNLQSVLAAYGASDPSYARLYFDSTPLRHAAAWRILAGLGDDSSTYLWRVMAAREIMRLHRDDPEALAAQARLQGAKASAEEVLHPRAETEVFSEPGDVEDARADGDLAALPAPAALGMRRDPRMGELAPRLDREPALYFALRPEALATARYIARGVERISGRDEPLTMTSAVRDRAYQRLLSARNPEATHAYSLHTTGYAFDLLRRYSTRGQAEALQFMLDRLQAYDLIAWVREPAAIHVTASDEADRLRLP
jgi:hypothetical protein